MKWLNRISIIVLIGFSILIGFQSIKLGMGNLSKMGPGFMPLIVSILLFSLSMLILIGEKKGSEEEIPTGEKNVLKPLGLIIVLFAYMFLLDVVGYLTVTFCLMFCMFVMSNPKKWHLHIGIAAIVAVLSFVLFDKLLQLRLPTGILNIG
jgi:putative tricarboxylic transport membrane protein